MPTDGEVAVGVSADAVVGEGFAGASGVSGRAIPSPLRASQPMVVRSSPEQWRGGLARVHSAIGRRGWRLVRSD